MVRLIGIPRSIAQSTRRLLSGSLGDVLWKVFVTIVIVLLGYALLAFGGALGGIVGGIMLGMLISDDVRQAVRDVYNRRWAELGGS